jgi:hypothetical protein
MMMKQKAMRLAKRLGATIEGDIEHSSGALYLRAPEGKCVADGQHIFSYQFNYGTKGEAWELMVEDLERGFSDCDCDECQPDEPDPEPPGLEEPADACDYCSSLGAEVCDCTDRSAPAFTSGLDERKPPADEATGLEYLRPAPEADAPFEEIERHALRHDWERCWASDDPEAELPTLTARKFVAGEWPGEPLDFLPGDWRIFVGRDPERYFAAHYLLHQSRERCVLYRQALVSLERESIDHDWTPYLKRVRYRVPGRIIARRLDIGCGTSEGRLCVTGPTVKRLRNGRVLIAKLRQWWPRLFDLGTVSLSWEGYGDGCDFCTVLIERYPEQKSDTPIEHALLA